MLMKIIHVFAAITAFLALIATMQCYLGSSGLKVSYAKSPGQVTYLTSRIMSMQTFISLCIRATFVYSPNNLQVYFLAMCTYFNVFMHYTMEFLIFQTAPLSMTNLVPYLIAVVMLSLMSIGYIKYGGKQQTSDDLDSRGDKKDQ